MRATVKIVSLEPYSQSVFWSDRYAVADNPSTPVEMRQQLALDIAILIELRTLTIHIRTNA